MTFRDESHTALQVTKRHADVPTSEQYKIGVDIGHATVAAMKAGASYEDVIETLHHQIALAERNRAMGIDLTK